MSYRKKKKMGETGRGYKTVNTEPEIIALQIELSGSFPPIPSVIGEG